MKAFKVTAIALAIGSVSAYTHTASAATPAFGDIVTVGCTAPSAGIAGSTVYSIDAINNQGNPINVVTANANVSTNTNVNFIGQSCTGVLNQIRNANQCAGGQWVASNEHVTFARSSEGPLVLGSLTTTTTIGGVEPTLITVGGTGYALQQFILTCVDN